MKSVHLFLVLIIITILCGCSTGKKTLPMSLTTSFEKNNNVTATYDEVIDFYQKLASKYSEINLSPFGMTDIGLPLHEIVLSSDRTFDPLNAKENDKLILFINNAIHPGEPCGVDATMMWVRDILEGKKSLSNHIVLVIIPFYNIGGGLNRNSHSRTNQEGPEAYGFRGNVRNFDLNRDFVKCDSKNARSFNQLFNKWSPHVMIDNHTSNGADYQYTMTLIAPQKDKLAPEISEVLSSSMLPYLYNDMEDKGWEMTPYVYSKESPDAGIYGFLDYARYSSGYAALHHTLAFMPETHMLKPYKDRVYSTYEFMQSMLEYVTLYPAEVLDAYQKAINNYKAKNEVALDWKLDVSKKDSFLFKGYTAAYKPSKVSGLPRLYYDRNQPYEKHVPFYDSYQTKLSVESPKQYIIPQAYDAVIERLFWNGVQIDTLEQHMTMDVMAYYIEDFEDTPAYEGHYLHHSILVRKEKMKVNFRKGDYIIEVNQDSKRYLMETLEPQAPDGFFAWNFFDAILMQKEYFSSYVFEDLAAEYLKNNPELREKLEAKKRQDSEFAEDGRAQLDWVYKNSPHYENTHRRYPVYRVE